MIAQIESEVKIFGINFFIVSVTFTVAMIVLSIIAGDLLDFYPVSFEVVFPFFVTIVVGEWGKTRADSNFDIIAAQSKSLFKWVLLRYIIAFAISSLFAVFSMAGASVMRYEMPIWELIVLYFPPTFFLSSLCNTIGERSSRKAKRRRKITSHIPASSRRGMLWIRNIPPQQALRGKRVAKTAHGLFRAGIPAG